jgi:outer membrane protein assembly factor BamB
MVRPASSQPFTELKPPARFGARVLGGAALLLAILAGLSAPARSAEPVEVEKPDEEFDPRVYLDTEDDATGLIRAAWRARSAEPPNWRAAIEKYLEVAREYGHIVYAQTDRLYLPVRVLVRKELSELPKEGREIYKVLKSREAELAYRRAVLSGSTRELERIPRGFPCLAPAPRALYLLGEWSRARGQAGRAIYYWQRLMNDYPDWEEGSRAALAARAALVAAEAGRRAEGRQLLGLLMKTSGLLKLRVGNRELLLADEIRRRLKSSGSTVSVAREGFWPSIGGGAAHDGVVHRVIDAGVRRWQKPLGGTAVKSRSARRSYLAPNIRPTTGSYRHAVTSGGMVFLAGDSDIIALRAKSGHVVWPAAKTGRPNYKLPCTRMTLPAVGDGKVFVVMGAPQVNSPSRFGNRGGGTFKSKVTLRAYAVTGGKLRWESGRFENAPTREFLSSVDLVSAPVYSGGYVYCGAVKRGSVSDAYMLCFDAADGRLVWKTFVCAGHPIQGGYSYRSYPVTEDALPAAVSEGLVAFVTNLGAVGVMDAASGDLLWVYLYDRPETTAKRDRFGRATASSTSTWSASAPIIRDGVLYIAPQDSKHLLAMELTTGKLLWKSRRGKLKHLVGISGNYLVCSGAREVLAFSARSGKRLWRGLLSGAEAGLGVVGKDFAVIPSSTGLQRFDLRTGKLKASYRFRTGSAESGNLIISGDVMVSVGKSKVGGYYSWNEIVTKLEKQVVATPGAAAPRAELAEVYFYAEKYRQAADYFKQSLARVKPGESVAGMALKPLLLRQVWQSHSRLGKTLEAAGKGADALKDYRQAHAYARRDAANMNRQMMTGHMRFARCKASLGDWSGAVAEYQECLYTPAAHDASAGRSRYYSESCRSVSGSRVMAGAFAKAQIDRLVSAHGAAVYQKFEARARELLATAGREHSVKRALAVTRWYPNSTAVSPALILASELYTAAGKHTQASARLREHLIKRSKSPRELEVRARLALSYKAQGMAALTRSIMGRMLRSWKGQSFELGGARWTVENFVEKHKPAGQLAMSGGLLPEMGSRMKTAWRVTTGLNTALIPKAGLHEMTGTAFLRLNRRNVMAVDLKTGKRLWTKTGLKHFGNHSQYLNARAGAAVVAVASGHKLVALAPATGQMLWEKPLLPKPANNPRRRFGSSYCMIEVGDGVVVASPYWSGYDAKLRRNIAQSKILVLDEGTGKQLWATPARQIMLGGLRLFEGTLYVSFYDRKRNTAVVEAYEVADGSKRFTADLTGSGYAHPIGLHLQGDRLVVVNRHTTYCFDTNTGKLKWRGREGNSQGYLLAADDARVVTAAFTYNRGKRQLWVIARNLETGKKLWSSQPLNGYMQNVRYRFGATGLDIKPAPSTDKIVLSYQEYKQRKMTYACATYDGKTGKMLWRSQLPPGFNQGPVLIGRQHAAATITNRRKSELRVWNLQTGKLVHKQSSAGYGFLTAQEGSILRVSSRDVVKLVPEKSPKKPTERRK